MIKTPDCSDEWFGGWLLCRYYDRSAASDYRNVTDTVQQIESDNQSARSDIGHAAGSIDRATEQLDGATTALDQAGQSWFVLR